MMLSLDALNFLYILATLDPKNEANLKEWQSLCGNHPQKHHFWSNHHFICVDLSVEISKIGFTGPQMDD